MFRLRSSLLVFGLVLACGPDMPALHVSPHEGSRAGGLAVKIQGAGRTEQGEPVVLTEHGPVAIYFDTKAALGVVIEGDTMITAIVPQHQEPGTVDVRLMFDDGVDLTIVGGYTYDDSPGVVLRPSIVQQ